MNIDENEIEEAITPKTKAIVVVHYAGISPDMDKIMEICKKIQFESCRRCCTRIYGKI